MLTMLRMRMHRRAWCSECTENPPPGLRKHKPKLSEGELEQIRKFRIPRQERTDIEWCRQMNVDFQSPSITELALAETRTPAEIEAAYHRAKVPNRVPRREKRMKKGDEVCDNCGTKVAELHHVVNTKPVVDEYGEPVIDEKGKPAEEVVFDQWLCWNCY